MAISFLSSQWLYMTEKRLKTAQVNLRLEPKLKAAAERAAAKDHRSLTSLVEKLLADHLTKLKLPPKPRTDDGNPKGHVTDADDADRIG